VSIIKSFAVGNGDMFYINHDSDNFTIIDCCLSTENEDEILAELKFLKSKKGITRFISTHADDDHLRGLELLEETVEIKNFYCVKNAATKSDETDSFNSYCALRDHEKKAFYIYKGCRRKWMNVRDDVRDSAGISILWPDVNNAEFKAALNDAEEGLSPNNLSPIIKYSLKGGASVLWMGDLEADFMEDISDHVNLPAVDIIFAPHHGRSSGQIPNSWLEEMGPKIIVVGEAPSEHLHYYPEYNTITQNSAGDIIFACEKGKVHVFTSNDYETDFLEDESMSFGRYYYVGTLNL
jgi:beta-lactamase superfamily II metal-dependent hydrolase